MSVLDIFRPKWKNSRCQVRLETVKNGRLSQSTLKKIICNGNESTEIRLAAVEKIENQEDLSDLFFKTNGIRSEILHKIHSFDLLLDIQKQSRERKYSNRILEMVSRRIDDVDMLLMCNRS